MAFFIGGTTYQPGGQVTDTNLNALITAAIPQLLNRDHFASDSKIVTVAAGKTASPAAGELCWDSSVGVLFVFDGSNWIGIAPQSLRIFTAQSTISVNDVVVLDTANASSVKTNTNAAGLDEVVGVARTAATTGQTVLVQTDEAGLVSCTSGAVNIGQYLAKSTTAGKAEATIAGNGFAIALSSKSGGSEGTVTAFLGKKSPGQVSASFATYSMTATLTNATFYDFPNAALGAVTASTNGGANAMKITIRTSRADQPVTFTVIGLDIRTNTASAFFDGYRILIQDSGLNDTSVMANTTKGSAFRDADGEEETFCAGAVVYRITATSVGISVLGASVMFTIPTAGTYTIRPQFRAANAGSVSYPITQPGGAATLVAVAH